MTFQSKWSISQKQSHLIKSKNLINEKTAIKLNASTQGTPIHYPYLLYTCLAGLIFLDLRHWFYPACANLYLSFLKSKLNFKNHFVDLLNYFYSSEPKIQLIVPISIFFYKRKTILIQTALHEATLKAWWGEGGGSGSGTLKRDSNRSLSISLTVARSKRVHSV